MEVTKENVGDALKFTGRFMSAWNLSMSLAGGPEKEEDAAKFAEELHAEGIVEKTINTTSAAKIAAYKWIDNK